MKKFVMWLNRRVDVRQLLLALGHDLREFALLWLVFSFLDPLVAGTFSFRWTITNAVFGIVLWTSGSYIELRRSRKGRT
ncbi:MAG TPA: hypothetical protein VJZ00_19770 [Thermoanaerobaculia bacterium]|nr:hypothetical protein [Thermoanaerobaculia bacterium]